MIHVGAPPPFVEEALAHLGRGDILTHCYSPHYGGIVDHRLRVKDAVWEARDRGVLFDVGHGGGSFSFDVAEAALDQGFPPDAISSDLHSRCIAGPAFDLPTVLSKFLALGMDLAEVVARATHLPAEAVGAEVGTLRPGAAADIALFRLAEGETTFADCPGAERAGSARLVAEATIVDGRALEPVRDDRSEVYETPAFPLPRTRETR